MAILLAFMLGLVSSVLFKGINVTITHKQEEKKQETPKYNESMVKHLPPEVQQYYNSTQGMNKF